jgi:hypothetical protein
MERARVLRPDVPWRGFVVALEESFSIISTAIDGFVS